MAVGIAHFLLVVAALLALLPSAAASRNSDNKRKKKKQGTLRSCDEKNCYVNGSSFADLSASASGSAWGFFGSRQRQPGDAEIHKTILEWLKNLGEGSSEPRKDCGVKVEAKSLVVMIGNTDKKEDERWNEQVRDPIMKQLEDLRGEIQSLTEELLDLQRENKSLAERMPRTISEGEYVKFTEDVLGDQKDCWEQKKTEDLTPKVDAIKERIDEWIDNAGGIDKVTVLGSVYFDAFKAWQGGSEDTDACRLIRSSVAEFINLKPISRWRHSMLELEAKMTDKAKKVDDAHQDDATCTAKQAEFEIFYRQVKAMKKERAEKGRVLRTAEEKRKSVNASVNAIEESLRNQTAIFESIKALLVTQGAKAAVMVKLVEAHEQAEKEMIQKTEDAKKELEDIVDAMKRSTKAFVEADRFKILLDEFVQMALRAHAEVLQAPLQDKLGLEYQDLSTLFGEVRDSDEHSIVKQSLQGLQDVCTEHSDDLAIENVMECDKTPADMCDEQIRQTDATMGNVVASLEETRSFVSEDLRILFETLGLDAQGPDSLEAERTRWQEPAGALKFKHFYNESTFYTNYLRGWMVHAVVDRNNEVKVHGRVLLKLWWYLHNSQKDLETKAAGQKTSHTELVVKLEQTTEAGEELKQKLTTAMGTLDLTVAQKAEARNELDQLEQELEKLRQELKQAEDNFQEADIAFKSATKIVEKRRKDMQQSLLQLGFSEEDLQKSLFEMTPEDLEFLRLAGSKRNVPPQLDRSASELSDEGPADQSRVTQAFHFTRSVLNNIRAIVLQTP